MHHRGRPRHDDVLTPREWDVLSCIREGLTNEEIADRLGVSSNTVKYHVSEILGKLEVRNREAAAAWRGRPKPALGLAPVTAFFQQAGSMSPWKLVGGGALVAAGVVVALLALGVVLSKEAPSLGKIAFVRDGNIWVQELPDGTPYQLTDTTDASSPQWSPSGEWLLYVDQDTQDGDKLRDEWLIKSDGTGERLLDSLGFSAYWAPGPDDRIHYFTPDETMVAEGPGGGDRVILAEPAIEGDHRVVRYPFADFPESGRKFFIEAHYPANLAARDNPGPLYQALWVSDRDGTNAQELTEWGSLDPGQETTVLPLTWTSTGSQLFIVYQTEMDGHPLKESMELRAISTTAGGEPIPLGINTVLSLDRESGPSAIAFVAGESFHTWTDKRIAVVPNTADGYTLLTSPDLAATQPRWSPDGSRIAFVANPDLGPDAGDEALTLRRIWLMDADGANQRQLTSGEGLRDASPMWSQDGESLLFARMSTEDPCYSTSYDLMRYELESDTVTILAQDLPLYGAVVNVEIGQVPRCDFGPSGLTTDTYGQLNLRSVLDWWQPRSE